MKKIKEIIKNSSFKNWMIVIIITLFIGFPFLKFHITSDGYSHLMGNFAKGRNVLLSNTGRPLSDFVISYFNILGFNIIKYQSFFNFLSIVITIISMYVFYKKINEITNNKITSQLLLILSTLFIYMNVFSFELYLFSVMFSISIQYLLITISLNFITENISFKNIVYSVVLNGLGAFFYQGILPLYLPLAFLIVGFINKNKNFKTYVIENIKIFLIFGFSVISNFLYLKILPANRYEVGLGFKERIKSILSAQKLLWVDTYNIFVKYSFLMIILLLIIIAIYIIIKNKKSKKINDFLTLVLAFFTPIVASYAAVFVSGIIFVPRAVTIVSSLPGILMLFILMFRKESPENNKLNLNFIFCLISICLCLFLVEASSSMVGELIDTNSRDKDEIQKIYNIIKDADVDYVSFAPDMFISYTYTVRYNTIEAYVRSFSTVWSRTNSINYYLKTNYQEVEATEEIKAYCSNNNWSEFNKEQIIIKDKVAYICIY